MQKSYPQYRINYRFCQEKDHTFQKANLVCLKKQCVENSLICSLCLEEKHQGHLTKPLKHFLENLQKTYSSSSRISIDVHLKQLEQMKQFLFGKIKQAVQKLANSFLQLEEEVMRNYDLIKHQIIEKEAKQNRFKSFYHSMAFQGKGDPNFQLENYLNFQPLNSFNLSNGLGSFIEQTTKNLQKIKLNLIRKTKEDYQHLQQQPKFNIINQSPDNFIIPSSIKRTNDSFSQQLITSKQTVGYLSTMLKNWTGKMRIKVINLDKIATFTIGIAKLEDVVDSKHVFPLKNNQKAYFINSQGVSQNQTCNFITSITKGDHIDIMLKKNKCKILKKGNLCNFQSIDKQKSVFFFSLGGACEIQILYPYKKD